MANGLYLGRLATSPGAAPGERLELDPDDLLTHAFIVGMTGSGKTGLAVDMIEELLRRGVPVLAVDPKGDLGNLLLLFDKLDADSFAPWVDPETKREGKTAADIAATWTKGLAGWGLGPADVAALHASHEAVIYTPGASFGVPLNILGSLEAPSVAFDSAADDLRDEIAGAVTGLLGLLGIDADPLQSREFILLSTLIESAWRAGKDLSLESLLSGIADPPFEKLGALPVESVYPRKERQGLMLALNNLLAAPSFEAWRQGEPLDIDRMLRTSDGRPRLSVVYTAHLSDAERLFVTALLLDKVKTWMRAQGGTSELRAVLYMDEIFGYFPPSANPPTKRPLLTLLKQARAQGVSVVLATQNPVDLDYKGLANMGTWLVGTLQTAQDKARLREGLQGSGLEPSAIDALMAGTRKRVFLLHDVHRSAPCLVESRWAMSYLRGPLTRDDVGRLMKNRPQPAAPTPAPARVAAAGPPVLPAPYRNNYFAKYGAERATPYLLAKYALRLKGAGEAIAVRAWPLLAPSAAEVLDADALDIDETQVSTAAPASLQYGDLPGWFDADAAKEVDRALRDRLPAKLATSLFFDPVTKQTSRPGERPDAFAERLAATDGGDAARKLQDRLEKKRRDLAGEQQNLTGRKTEKWAAIGGAILSNLAILTGRKRTISGASSVLTKNRMENNAEARVEGLQAEIADLESQLAALSSVDPGRFEARDLRPGKGDVSVLRCDVVWVH